MNATAFNWSEQTPSHLTLDRILTPDSGLRAFEKVRSNRGCPGSDAIPITELAEVFPAQWEATCQAIRAGRYRPQPLRRVEIPKASGGVRRLGIPSVMDRVVQQAIAQSLGLWFEPRFSPGSFAYRPGRSPHDAIGALQRLLSENDRGWILHLDIRDFFDSVPHGVVRGLLEREPFDPRLPDLVEAGLKSGVFEGGLVRPTERGVPQGSPLSPLLANVVLHEIDAWLSGQGRAFVRYADDIVIPLSIRAEAASLIDAIDGRLRTMGMELNREKTELTPWTEAAFLGFGFAPGPDRLPTRRISSASLGDCRAEIDRVVPASGRWFGGDPAAITREAATFLQSWAGYYGFTQDREQIESLFAHARERLATAFPGVDLSALRIEEPAVPGSIPHAGRPEARRMEYNGRVRAPESGPTGGTGGMRWPATLRCWATQLLRSRLVRVRLEFGRARRGGGWFPRPTGIRFLIGGHQFHFRF